MRRIVIELKKHSRISLTPVLGERLDGAIKRYAGHLRGLEPKQVLLQDYDPRVSSKYRYTPAPALLKTLKKALEAEQLLEPKTKAGIAPLVPFVPMRQRRKRQKHGLAGITNGIGDAKNIPSNGLGDKTIHGKAPGTTMNTKAAKAPTRKQPAVKSKQSPGKASKASASSGGKNKRGKSELSKSPTGLSKTPGRSKPRKGLAKSGAGTSKAKSSKVKAQPRGQKPALAQAAAKTEAKALSKDRGSRVQQPTDRAKPRQNRRSMSKKPSTKTASLTQLSSAKKQMPDKPPRAKLPKSPPRAKLPKSKKTTRASKPTKRPKGKTG
jgi:hypothetical protein